MKYKITIEEVSEVNEVAETYENKNTKETRDSIYFVEDQDKKNWLLLKRMTGKKIEIRTNVLTQIVELDSLTEVIKAINELK